MENKEIKKEKISLKQMSRVAIIVSVVLVLILVIGIIISNVTGIKQIKDSTNVEFGSVAELSLNAKDFFDVKNDIAAKITFDTSKVDLNKVGEYEAYAKYNNKQYTIKVVVEDTTAPKVTMENRYIFTNDIAALSDFSAIVHEAKDASELTYKLVRFEKKKELVEVNDLELRNLTEGAVAFPKAEDALLVGTEEVPTQPGIYRSVLEIADVHGNASYEEVVVILDTTGAKIEDTPDKTITVSKDKLSEEPEVDKSDYIINDNVDGKIAEENINCTLELRDEEKHEWLVHVSYTDRAGNDSNATFLITVKEEQKKQNITTKQESTQDSGASKQEESDKPVNNQDVSTWEPTGDENEISPYMQMLIDAGYGVVVDYGDGTYGVLTHNDGTVDGKTGGQILREYLAALDLEATHIYGGVIDQDDDWYSYTAENVRELITPDEEEFWHD